MSYIFNPVGLASMLESLGTNSPSVSVEDGIKVFCCGVQCEMLLGHAKYRGNVRSVYVSLKERYVIVDYDWCCIWSNEFKRWSKVGSLKSRIPYHEHYFQDDEDRVKIKHILKIPSARFFRMDDHTHLIDTKDGYVSRWFLPKMAMFRKTVIAILLSKKIKKVI